MLREGRLYSDLAEYYDQINHWKDYRKEVTTLRALIRKNKRTTGKALLDVGCGTGKHINYLRKDFDCTGVDASEKMLAVARRNVSGVKFVQGNMTNFDLGKKFDVVLCLFSAIGHLLTKREIRMAASNFARHMKKGGVLIIEPWIKKSDWKPGTIHLRVYDTGNLKIVRLSYSRMSGNFSLLDERYLIGKKGEGTEHVEDHHKMRLFEPEVLLSALERAGLDARFTTESLMPGRGLVIATKR
jgi:ubiquinone/menaquinone biosynthesis C-methylase UbiE